MSDKGFNLIGYATSPLGLGEDLRSFAAMLDYLNIPFSVIDLPTESQNQVSVSWKNLSQEDFSVSIFFMSAGTCLRLAELHPHLFTQPKMKLGYFLWELPDFPKKYLKALKLVDHIWCPTKFVQAAFFDKAKKLTLAIPLPVIKHPHSGKKFREELGIPKDAFVSLFIFDIHSTLNRKNPQGAIEAYLRASEGDLDHYLILKINRSKGMLHNRHKWLPTHPRIKYVTESLTPNQLADLYRSANCYLSLHRSEGFGRTLVEALQHGLTVISTDFSGPADFLNKTNSLILGWDKKTVNRGDYPDCDPSWWSEPSIDDAVLQLQKARKIKKGSKKLKAKETGAQFTVEALASKYKPILMSYLR